MYELLPLPYSADALEPHLDARTMEIHHDKHHATYVAKLNEAVGKFPELFSKSPEELLKDLNAVPDSIRTAVRNHGGGHVAHSLFWNSMGPQKGGEPTGDFAEAFTKHLGGFATFKEDFSKLGASVFGSGWAWLVADKDGVLKIMGTSNHDNPLSQGLTPLMCLDVWEHAYYLKFQNRRTDFITEWWNVVDWESIAKRYQNHA